uniref:Uncharacterized protein n=1 Tax=Opuntia streptacantha TaxID=393608 RepID=A0A7C9DSQ4_OPUST
MQDVFSGVKCAACIGLNARIRHDGLIRAKHIRRGVSDISSALVKRHYNLELQPVFPDHLHELGIAVPVICERSIFLDQSPPGIYHDSFYAGTLQCHQTSIHRSWLA